MTSSENQAHGGIRGSVRLRRAGCWGSPATEIRRRVCARGAGPEEVSEVRHEEPGQAVAAAHGVGVPGKAIDRITGRHRVRSAGAWVIASRERLGFRRISSDREVSRCGWT